MKTALHGKIKERGGEWIIGAKYKIYLTFQLQQHNTRQDKGA